MSIATEITRLQNAKAAIKTAIEGKGVTVPDATLMDGMAALIDAIEAGGGGGTPADYRGFPIATGTFTTASDIKTSYKLEFPEGNRLRVKTNNGYINRPFFLLYLANPSTVGSSTPYINFVSAPNFGDEYSVMNVYAYINAYAVDASSWSSSFMALTSLAWGKTADSVNTLTEVDMTWTDVTIPCVSSKRQLKAGGVYRYIVGAPLEIPFTSVEVV